MDATEHQLRRRQTGKKTLGVAAVTATVAMVATALIAPAANADNKTPTSVSAAHAHGLQVSLAGQPLAGSADAYRQWAASGQTGNKSDTINLSALGGNLDLGSGLSIPLLSNGTNDGLLDLGGLGVLTSLADAPYQSQATASSGILGDSGSVMLSPSDVPTNFKPATLDLSKLLGELPANDQAVLNKVALEIGALGSTASATSGVQAPSTDYMLAGAKLSVDSPLVGNLGSTLETSIGELGEGLNEAVGEGGSVSQLIQSLSLDVGSGILGVSLLKLDMSDGQIALTGLDAALQTAASELLAEPLKDPNGIVEIHLGAGKIDVDLSRVVDGGDLNSLDPNTELLSGPALTEITTAVTEALATLTTKVTEVVDGVLNNTGVQVTIPVKVSALAGLIPAADAVIAIDLTLGQLTGDVEGAPEIKIEATGVGLLNPLLDLLGDVTTELLNPVLSLVVEDTLGPVVKTLKMTLSSSLASTLNGTIDDLSPLLDPVLGMLNQLVSVRANEQPTASPINSVGDFGVNSTTVRALAVTLLPSGSSGAARVELASSTVKHKFDAPVPGDSNTNASASAAASAAANGDNDTAAQGSAIAAAMADNSVSADAAATADAEAAAKSAALITATSDASADATTEANASAQAAATASQDSTSDNAEDADASAAGNSDSGAASEAAAQTTASADASTAAAGSTSGSTSTSTTIADATADASGASSEADANVNAAASASADSNANAASKAAAMADATSTASAKATANAQTAAESAATTTASTKASTKADAASIAAAQAAALAKANDDTNAAASAAAKGNAAAAAKAAAIADASSDASGNNPNPNTAKCLTPSPQTPFLDTPTNHKFYTEIDWMYCMKYTTGIKTDAGLIYGPQMRLSREAMAAFIYRMEADPNWKLPAVSPFADMKPGDKFYKEIVWMYDQGLSTGIKQAEGKPIYGPKLRLSREAMAAFIYRLEDPKGYSAPAVSKMQDMKRGDKFYTEINWMVDEGLSTGIRVENGGREYWPKNRLSREAMAAFIHRLVNDYR